MLWKQGFERPEFTWSQKLKLDIFIEFWYILEHVWTQITTTTQHHTRELGSTLQHLQGWHQVYDWLKGSDSVAADWSGSKATPSAPAEGLEGLQIIC